MLAIYTHTPGGDPYSGQPAVILTPLGQATTIVVPTQALSATFALTANYVITPDYVFP
jgi:hypothetical protein